VALERQQLERRVLQVLDALLGELDRSGGQRAAANDRWSPPDIRQKSCRFVGGLLLGAADPLLTARASRGRREDQALVGTTPDDCVPKRPRTTIP
jgi:hypothetical protein